MTIDDLAGLAAVARAGSFSRAAEATHRSQPAVSLQVARLERELGTRLLDRTGGVARPTRDGAAVVALAEEILQRVRRIAALEPGRGRLVVGAPQAVARWILPRALRDFARRFAAVEVAVRTDASVELLRAVKEGRIDLAVLSQPLAAPGVRVRPFRRYGFVEVGSGEGFILPERGSATRAHIDAARPGLDVVLETESTDVALAMARAGVGTAILPSFAGAGRRDRRIPPQALCLAWREGSADAARDTLADLLRRR